jgi:hypothetical protein
MGFLNRIFSKKQQLQTPNRDEMAIVGAFATDVVYREEKAFFKCPSCQDTMSISQLQIDPIIGVNVACSSCKNIAHVPGGYKMDPPLVGLRIAGSVRVPIAKFGDWYYAHPLIASLIKSGQSDLLFDYGLWAFCSVCYHQFHATVLSYFAMAQATYFSNPGSTGGFIFNARTPESAKDMEALRAGHCPHCQNENLIVIIAEIPDYVRTILISSRK